MALGGCLKCIKYTLFVFNFIFWLVGCLLLAVGIWALVDPGPFREYASGYEWQASILLYAMMTIGSIMTITGFLGCCGAIRESRCPLILFFVLLFVINAIFVTVGLYLMFQRDKVSEWLPPPEREKISKDLYAKINSIAQDETAITYMEAIHLRYKCCGADLGERDYRELNPPIISCRKRPMKPCTDQIFKTQKDRHNTRMRELPKYVVIVAGIILGISSLMIVGLVLSITLFCALKNELIVTY